MLDQIRKAAADNLDFLTGLASKMVQIGSYPGEEEKVQLFLKDELEKLGMETRLVKADPLKLEKYRGFSSDGFPYDRRYSLVGTKKGSGQTNNCSNSGPSIILNGHVDIVPPGDFTLWNDHPLSGKVKNGRIYGRGSLDMKGGLAAAITAIKILGDLKYKHGGDIHLASVCGEETGGCGSFSLIESGLKADGCIILEPTKLNICHIQSGCHTFKMRLKGRSIHACMAYKGVNAVDKFCYLYGAMQELDRQRHERFKKEQPELAFYYENQSNIAPFNVGTVSAGEWPSSVPDTMEVTGRMGIFPGEKVEEMHDEFEGAIYEAAQRDPWLREMPPEIEWYEGLFEPSCLDKHNDLIKKLAVSHKAVIDDNVKYEAVTYGSDMRIFNIYGDIPTVLYGPGDVSIAHTVNEYAELKDLLDAVNVITHMLINWCGGGIDGADRSSQNA